MTIPEEEVWALSDAVAMWRMQEYIVISFYCLYVYYLFTTVSEEVSIILPQRWNRGKMLYAIIRYGTLAFIALQLSRDYRTYLSISPNVCKRLSISLEVFLSVISLACNFSLALCLGALLQARSIYVAGIVILSCGIPFVSSVIVLVSSFQYPAEQLSDIDAELGYPCYVTSVGGWEENTITYTGRDIRAYVNLAATTLLALLGIVTLVIRYKGQDGRLIQVIRRDGGLHYLSLLVIRMISAIILTQSVLPLEEIDASPLNLLSQVGDLVIIPILAQRLLINMRKVDYMGSEPVASKLLFAPPAPGTESEDDLEEDLDSFDMASEPYALHHRRDAEKGSDMGEAGPNA
ncbi:hypothetical protein FA13DRAFT_1816390 [Coprinellus micaceus]|uniref:DUF6533 domain-containing protein n=1 Tax=Coprinellus micaceus TaxID=71717 RepID=A0A4Y7T039_COPMI|nr:hypothetical protein FA13DRAFT_1816390 [Coprinellus micaceus]